MDTDVQVWRSCDTVKARVRGETRQAGVGRWPRGRGDGCQTHSDAFVCRGTHPRKKTDGSKRNESTHDARIEGITNDGRAFQSRGSHVPFRVPRPRLVASTASTHSSLPTHKHASGMDRGETWTARRCKTRRTCVSLRRIRGLHIEVRNIRYKPILARAARLGRRTRSIPSQEACHGSTSTTFDPTTRSWSRRRRGRPRAVRDLFGQTPHLERWRIFLHGSKRSSFHVHARRSIVRQSFVRMRLGIDRSAGLGVRGLETLPRHHVTHLRLRFKRLTLFFFHCTFECVVSSHVFRQYVSPFQSPPTNPGRLSSIGSGGARLVSSSLSLLFFFSLSFPLWFRSFVLFFLFLFPFPSTWFCSRVVDLPWRAWSTKADAHGTIHTCGGVATQTLPHPPSPSLTLSLLHPLTLTLTHSLTHCQSLTETDTVPFDGEMGPGRWDSNRTPARPLRRAKGTLGEEDGPGKEKESSAGKGKKRTKKTLPVTDEEWCSSSDLSSATIGTMAFVWVVRPSLRVKRKVPILATVWRVRPWTRDARAIGEGRWRCHGPPSPSRTTCRASSSWWKSSIDRNVATPRSRPSTTDGNGMRRTIPSSRRVSSIADASQRLSSLLSSPSLRLPPTFVDDLEEGDAHPFPSRRTPPPPLLPPTRGASARRGVRVRVRRTRTGGGWLGDEGVRVVVGSPFAIRRESTCDSET